MHDANDRTSITIETASRQYARTDPAFLDQVAQLRRDLARAGAEIADGPSPGEKGLAELTPVIQAVVIGGPGLLALCGVAKLWLRQRGDRLLRITARDEGGRERVVEVDGRNVSDETLLAFSKDVAERLR